MSKKINTEIDIEKFRQHFINEIDRRIDRLGLYPTVTPDIGA